MFLGTAGKEDPFAPDHSNLGQTNLDEHQANTDDILLAGHLLHLHVQLQSIFKVVLAIDHPHPNIQLLHHQALHLEKNMVLIIQAIQELLLLVLLQLANPKDPRRTPTQMTPHLDKFRIFNDLFNGFKNAKKQLPTQIVLTSLLKFQTTSIPPFNL